jgi:ankyrin repeat protein
MSLSYVLLPGLFLCLGGQRLLAQEPESLFSALKNNDIKAVQAQLARGVSPVVCDADSDNVLFYSALYASADCMELLLKKGADPNVRNKADQTPLMWCAHDTAKVRLLLKYGADVNAVSRSGNTALMAAVVGSGQYAATRLLLDNGADALVINKRKETALIRAAQFGDVSSVALLMGRGIDINAMDGQGLTALTVALTYENKEVFMKLLDSGADVNVISKAGWNALTATVIDDAEMFKTILYRIRDVNHQDNDGVTPLMWTAFNEHDNPQFIQALLDRGALVNMRAKDGTTALSWAMKKGNTETVALLRKAGAKE